jgi:hypothetical protein
MEHAKAGQDANKEISGKKRDAAALLIYEPNNWP